MKITITITAQILKDIFHAVAPILLMFFLPQGWRTFFIVYVYILLKMYVYFFIKDFDKLSVVAVIGLLIDVILITGYLEAL